MAGKLVDLKLDRSLIDSKFDGYKLSLDPLSAYKINLEEGLDVAKLTEDQHSYQHIRAFGLTNHILADQWDRDSVYVVDETWNVIRITVNVETALDKGNSVFQIPDSANQKLAPGRHNVSLYFVSREWAVLGDGAGRIYLLETGPRGESGKLFTVAHTCEPIELGKCFVVQHAILRSVNETRQIECLLVHVEEVVGESKGKHSSPFETILEWVTFVSADGCHWELERTRRLVSSRCPEYAALDPKGQSIFLCSEKPVMMVYDSVKPVTPLAEESEEKGEEDQPPAYTWNQTMEDLHVEFTVPETVTKADIYLSLHPQQIEFGVKNNRVLLQGALSETVDIEGSTWSIEGQRVSLTLSKVEEKMWQTVVLGDSRGEMVMEPDQVAAIHERLAHLISSEWNPDPGKGDNQPYNTQELEECDTFPEDSAVLQRIDGESHEITHEVNISSHQWLFNVHLDANSLPAFCLRHDVDGVIWQPQMSPSEEDPWKHVATFNAFGYVQASKQQKKYCVSAPNSSYAVICDCVRHLYIYRQPSPISSPLRNRKTGRQVDAVAKQQVVALESVDDILGIQATDTRLYVLAGKTFHVVKVN